MKGRQQQDPQDHISKGQTEFFTYKYKAQELRGALCSITTLKKTIAKHCLNEWFDRFFSIPRIGRAAQGSPKLDLVMALSVKNPPLSLLGAQSWCCVAALLHTQPPILLFTFSTLTVKVFFPHNPHCRELEEQAVPSAVSSPCLLLTHPRPPGLPRCSG